MTYYKLYLIRDTRNSEARIAYNYIIGKVSSLKITTIRKLKFEICFLEVDTNKKYY